ncbi:unnamed protein product, partial [Closterium sp. Naga37s-1]
MRAVALRPQVAEEGRAIEEEGEGMEQGTLQQMENGDHNEEAATSYHANHPASATPSREAPSREAPSAASSHAAPPAATAIRTTAATAVRATAVGGPASSSRTCRSAAPTAQHVNTSP